MKDSVIGKKGEKGGGNMSLEVMKQVTEAEQVSQTRKAEALAAAKKTVADAERAGQAGLEEARARAQEQVKAFMQEAEAQAQKQTDRILTETKNACKALQASAEGRMSQAAALIVRRVVNA